MATKNSFVDEKVVITIQKKILDEKLNKQIKEYQLALEELSKKEKTVDDNIRVKVTSAYCPPFADGIAGICPICCKGAAPGLCKCEEHPALEPLVKATPPGREEQVKALKKQPNVKNPWAVAWASKDKSDAKKAETDLEKVAPPGMEEEVKALKSKYGKEGAFKVAWSIYDKKHGKSTKKSEYEPVHAIAEVEGNAASEGKDPSKIPHSVKMRAAQAIWASKQSAKSKKEIHEPDHRQPGLQPSKAKEKQLAEPRYYNKDSNEITKEHKIAKADFLDVHGEEVSFPNKKSIRPKPSSESINPITKKVIHECEGTVEKGKVPKTMPGTDDGETLKNGKIEKAKVMKKEFSSSIDGRGDAENKIRMDDNKGKKLNKIQLPMAPNAKRQMIQDSIKDSNKAGQKVMQTGSPQKPPKMPIPIPGGK